MIAVIWVLISVTGAIASVWNTLDAWADLRALGTLANGRRIIALGWVRREALRLLIQASWAAVGLLALGHVDPPLTPAILILVGTNLALLVSTVFDVRERLALRRILH